MVTTEAQKRASRNWTKKNIKNVSVGLRIDQDADIIAHLETVPNKQQYFRDLIREDMRRN